MRRRPRDILVLGCTTAVGLTVAVAGPGLAERMVHTRDTEAFHDYVTKDVGRWRSSLDPNGHKRDQRWVARNPDWVLAEGNQACSWLARQPSAPDIDESGYFSVHAMTQRYFASPERERVPPLSAMGQHAVVAGAWAYLCWATRENKTAPTGFEDD